MVANPQATQESALGAVRSNNDVLAALNRQRSGVFKSKIPRSYNIPSFVSHCSAPMTLLSDVFRSRRRALN